MTSQPRMCLTGCGGAANRRRNLKGSAEEARSTPSPPPRRAGSLSRLSVPPSSLWCSCYIIALTLLPGSPGSDMTNPPPLCHCVCVCVRGINMAFVASVCTLVNSHRPDALFTALSFAAARGQVLSLFPFFPPLTLRKKRRLTQTEEKQKLRLFPPQAGL